jgi:hypothetical protein
MCLLIPVISKKVGGTNVTEERGQNSRGPGAVKAYSKGKWILTRKIQFTDGLRQQGLEISVRPAIDGGPVPTGESRLKA